MLIRGFMLLLAVAGHARAESLDQITLATDTETIAPAGWFVAITPDGGTSETHDVTDAHLDFGQWEGDALAALQGANSPGRSPWTWVFQADLLVVAGGRLFRHGGGICSPWEADLSVCTIECDGGHFLLRRDITKASIRVDVILTPITDYIPEDRSAAIRIDNCGDGRLVELDRHGTDPAAISFRYPLGD